MFIVAYINANKNIYIYYISCIWSHWIPTSLDPTVSNRYRYLFGGLGKSPQRFSGIFQDGWIICSGIPHRKLTWHFFSSTVWRCISLLTNGNLPKNHVSLSEGIKQWICSSNPQCQPLLELGCVKKPEVSGGKNVCFFRFVGFFGIIAQDIDWTHWNYMTICRISSR